MSIESKNANDKHSAFGWIALGTGLALLIPLIAMQFTSEVSWRIADFIIMGALLFTTASAYVLVSRRAPRERRLMIGILFVVAFLYVWAELAVGLFTDLGS